MHGVRLKSRTCRAAGWKYGCGTRRPESSPSRPAGTGRRCTPAGSPPTTRRTWATPRPSRPGTCWSAPGSTPGTRSSTRRTSPTWTTRCSSGPSGTARTGGSSRCARPSGSAATWRRCATCRPPHFIGAVEAIPVIDAFAERLAARGALYDLDGDTYFARSADQRFGALAGPGTASGLSVAEMTELSAERGGDPERPGKKDPLDPLVWRARAARASPPGTRASARAGRAGTWSARRSPPSTSGRPSTCRRAAATWCSRITR